MKYTIVTAKDQRPTEGHSTGQHGAGGLNKNAKYSH